MNVLSVQSWVSVGHVGNAAAVFALQTLGAEVWPVHTVRFSNHPGRGTPAGEVTAAREVAALIDGIAALGVLRDCDAVLSGYLGAADTLGAVLEGVARARATNPDCLYCCDPVIGDDGRVYVRPGVEAAIRDQAVPAADILTPNLFELSRLTGLACDTERAMLDAVSALRSRMRAGPRIVLVTSARMPDTPAGMIDTLVADEQGFWRVRTPMIPASFSGAGDLLTAVFLFHVLAGETAARAASLAVSSVHAVLRRTAALGTPELALVPARDALRDPGQLFAATRI